MKSDREMVESILKKAHEKEKKMKRSRKITALALTLAVAVCAAAGAGIMMRKTPSTVTPAAPDTSVSNETETAPPNAAAGFSLLVASAAEVQPGDPLTRVEHTSGVKLPISGQLVIENVSGRNEEEKSLRLNQLSENLSREWQISSDGIGHHIGVAESENHIGLLAFQGKFIVFADDVDALQQIEMNCGAYGQLVIMPAMWNGKMPALGREWFAAIKGGQSLTVSAQEYTDIYLNSNVDEASGSTEPIGMFVNYDITEAFLNEKELRPDMGYEQFADEITFRAVYKDGSENSYTVLLTFDENGTLSASMK